MSIAVTIMFSRSHAPRGNAFAPRCGARLGASLLRSHAARENEKKCLPALGNSA